MIIQIRSKPHYYFHFRVKLQNKYFTINLLAPRHIIIQIHSKPHYFYFHVKLQNKENQQYLQLTNRYLHLVTS